MNETEKDPLVSVIIPTHNRANMVSRAIRSVLAQTYTDFEVLVVSDGSTDNTEEVVKAMQDSRIRFFEHEEPQGASAARNMGLRAARGEYLAFLDDDDEWMSDKLEVQLPVIENSPPEVGLVYAWMEYFCDGKSQSVYAPVLRGDVFADMLDNQAIGGCPTVMIKREVLDKVGYFDEDLPRGNDGNYWRRISQQYHVDYAPKVLARVNVGHDGRISDNNRKNLSHEIHALRKRLEVFREQFKSHPEKKVLVLSRIGVDYLVIGRIPLAIRYLWKSLTVAGVGRGKWRIVYGSVRRGIRLLIRRQ